MKTKRGRPRGSTGNARNGLIQLRADDLEKQGFTEAAQIAGLTVSAWARERLRQICRQELEANGRNVPFLLAAPDSKR